MKCSPGDAATENRDCTMQRQEQCQCCHRDFQRLLAHLARNEICAATYDGASAPPPDDEDLDFVVESLEAVAEQSRRLHAEARSCLGEAAAGDSDDDGATHDPPPSPPPHPAQPPPTAVDLPPGPVLSEYPVHRGGQKGDRRYFEYQQHRRNATANMDKTHPPENYNSTSIGEADLLKFQEQQNLSDALMQKILDLVRNRWDPDLPKGWSTLMIPKNLSGRVRVLGRK